MHRNREPLLHCAVFIELTASDMDGLKLLQTDVLTELVRSKLNVDRLMLRQQQGFISVGPTGRNGLACLRSRAMSMQSSFLITLISSEILLWHLLYLVYWNIWVRYLKKPECHTETQTLWKLTASCSESWKRKSQLKATKEMIQIMKWWYRNAIYIKTQISVLINREERSNEEKP